MADRRKVNSADEVPKESDRQFLGFNMCVTSFKSQLTKDNNKVFFVSPPTTYAFKVWEERTTCGQLMRDALGKIIANRPEDPIAFLAEYFDSIEDQASLVQKACQMLKMTHHSRPLFESNVRSAYDCLSRHKVNKRVSGVNGAVYTQLLTALCVDIPEPVVSRLLQKLECANHEAVHFNVFKSSVFTCCVLQDYVKLAEQLFGALDIQRSGKANKALCDIVVEQLNTALGSSRTDARRILESGYNLGVDGLYLALDRALGRSQRNSTFQTSDQFVVELCEAFFTKVKKCG